MDWIHTEKKNDEEEEEERKRWVVIECWVCCVTRSLT